MSDEAQAELMGALEAVLMVVDEPVPAAALAEAVGVSSAAVEVALGELQREYDGEGELSIAGPRRVRGFDLRRVAGGWRIYSRPRYASVVGQFVVGTAVAVLSSAALETLAIIAYRQPVTRGQVSQIRGVNVDATVRMLQTRGLITEVGTTQTGAYLYETTPYFLECMGFETLEELLPLAPNLPAAAEIAELTLEVDE